MRYAIVSDIHANLDALRAVLDDARDLVDTILCLGDIVGYGAEPEGCIELVAERCQAVVAGNHEHAAAGLMPLDWFNPYARAAAEWTRRRLDDEHRAWLGRLPLLREFEEATLVHASPQQPDEWEYVISAEDGYRAFASFTTRLCFVGHSHVPGVWAQGSWGRSHEAGAVDIALEPGCRYLVNVGSVGQPRDRDPRAAWVLWDDQTRRVSIRRVAYDVTAARSRIVAAGLPRFLADRLGEGR
ncbi:MAG: metallophosphoesterase family protein [Candidatus Rokuibacteriota bacterium]